MGKITIQEIASKLITQNGLSKKEATLFVNMMFDLIREALERDKMVKVKGLGTFKIIDVESRESVNVNTGERVLIEGHNKITFTPDALMKELVNKPFSQFETVVLNDGVDFKDPKEDEASDIDDFDNDMSDMPLVDFIAPDPIVLGAPVEQEKPIDPVVSETPAVSNEPVAENPVLPEEPVAENPVLPEEVVAENPVLPEEVIAENPALPEEVIAENPVSSEDAIAENPVSPEEPVEESSAEDEYMEEEEEEDEEEEEEDIPASSVKWVIVFLASLISLLVGYMLGNYFPWNSPSSDDTLPQMEEVIDAAPVHKPEPKVADVPPVIKKAEAPAEEAAPSAEDAIKPVAPPVKQPETSKPVATAPDVVKFDKYEEKDARVRTGAYRIVGLDHKVKVKEGDNIQRIAKRTLGPGMECYIEVYNDLTATSPLKNGQEIKIPKLEWKKKKTAKK